jgi:hypothetical protein
VAELRRIGVLNGNILKVQKTINRLLVELTKMDIDWLV